MNNLALAMRVVTTEDQEEAYAMLAAAEAAHQAEQATEAAQKPVEAEVAEAVAGIDQDRLRLSEARADALNGAIQAIGRRQGIDNIVFGPADAANVYNVADLFVAIQDAERVALAEPFRARSSAADIAASAGVARAIAGGGQK